MKILAADIYDVNLSNQTSRSMWNLIILRLWADNGLYGLGEVALAYGTGKSAAVGMLADLMRDVVVGKEVFQVNKTWDEMYRRTFWGQGGGPVVYGAMSAVDCAMLDLKGKTLGLPVYDLLGGKTRDSIRVYANGWYVSRNGLHVKACVTPEEYAEAALRTVQEGFDALKFDPFMINCEGQVQYPERNLDKKVGDLAYQRVKAVREAVGGDVDILIEVHGNLGTTSAIQMGKRFSEFTPYFYEEPVDPMNVECMLKVAQNVPIPIAGGERIYTRYGFRPFIEKQALDILQPDLGLAGGITEVKKIAEYAEVYNLQIQPHNCAGPICTAASVQLDACINNFLIQEWFPYRNELFYSIVQDALENKVVKSRLSIPTDPGIGICLDEQNIRRYPCVHVSN